MADKPTPENAPEHCPGTQSDLAGKADACAGCPNKTACATAPKGPDPDIPIIASKLASVKNKILILSGKGGVGKSSFTTNLAFALSMDPNTSVGVLDIDLCGPSLPKMFHLEGEQIHQSNLGWSPVYVHENLAVMSIGFMLQKGDEAVIWRGPKKNGLIKQFLKDVDWGNGLDYLLIDTPPGTSDEHLSVVSFLKEAGITGAILITTPQDLAIQDVRKEISFCKKVRIPILGVVENMSGYACRKCHNTTPIFKPVSGGAKTMCEDMQVPFLGAIPLDPRLAMCCDEGQSFLDAFEDSPAAKAVFEVIDKVKETLG